MWRPLVERVVPPPQPPERQSKSSEKTAEPITARPAGERVGERERWGGNQDAFRRQLIPHGADKHKMFQSASSWATRWPPEPPLQAASQRSWQKKTKPKLIYWWDYIDIPIKRLFQCQIKSCDSQWCRATERTRVESRPVSFSQTLSCLQSFATNNHFWFRSEQKRKIVPRKFEIIQREPIFSPKMLSFPLSQLWFFWRSQHHQDLNHCW